MNVVFVRTYLQELDLVSLLYPKAHFLQNLLNIIVKYHPPVLRWKYQVVQQRRNVVTLVYVVTHPPKITPQGAGNLPALIKKYKRYVPPKLTFVHCPPKGAHASLEAARREA